MRYISLLVLLYSSTAILGSPANAQTDLFPIPIVFEGNHDVAQVFFWYSTDEPRDRSTVNRASYNQKLFFEHLNDVEESIPDGQVGAPMLLDYSQDEGFVLLAQGKRVPIFGSMERHPIDWVENNCRKQDPTTVGIINCLLVSRGLWDSEIDRAYRQLAVAYPIEAAREAWREYREAQEVLLHEAYSGRSGSIVGILVADKTNKLYKRHAMVLADLIEW